MDKDFGASLTAPASPAGVPVPRSGRYDFEVPEHLTISDMLAIQLADCVRITQTLSDHASDPQLHDTERLHTIQSLGNVVGASETLTRTIGRLRMDSWDDEPPRKRAKR
jgi:hypothetical protein